MSQPPERPGRRILGPGVEKRVERLSGRSGGGAYEGAFEAVGAILIATLLGYWFDQHYETTPTGLLVGAGIGFAAFVVRLVRLGKQLHPEASDPSGDEPGGAGTTTGADAEGDVHDGPGTGLGLSDLLEDEDSDQDRNERHEREP